MQVRATFLLVAASLLASTEAKPHFSNYLFNNYEYPTTHISAQPQYLQYQNPYTPYYFYNSDSKAVPTTIYTKPAIAQIPTYNFYYQPPVYDFRFPLNPVYPLFKPELPPGLLPKPDTPTTTSTPPSSSTTTTTEKPNEAEDDGIEKLDMKVEPESEKKKKPAESGTAEIDQDDTIAVEAI